MSMKPCSKCGESKEVIFFYTDKSTKDGVAHWCKDCKRKSTSESAKRNAPTVTKGKRDYYLKNQDKENARVSKWVDENKEKSQEYKKKYEVAHKEDKKRYAKENVVNIRKIKSAWKKRNPENACINAANRRSTKLNATPQWANSFFVDEIYHLCKLRNQMTGIKWHVDHVVPLNSKIVCGLHWEGNLQVIPAIVNINKNNRFWPDMP